MTTQWPPRRGAVSGGREKGWVSVTAGAARAPGRQAGGDRARVVKAAGDVHRAVGGRIGIGADREITNTAAEGMPGHRGPGKVRAERANRLGAGVDGPPVVPPAGVLG